MLTDFRIVLPVPFGPTSGGPTILSMKFNIVKEVGLCGDRSNENKKFRTQVSDGSANSNGQDFLPLTASLLSRAAAAATSSPPPSPPL